MKPCKKSNYFVIQRHHATNKHFDIRISYLNNAVGKCMLLSFAVPVSKFNEYMSSVGSKRIMLHPTEDHELEWRHFEGTIPLGQYGAGQVWIFDTGTLDYTSFSNRKITAYFKSTKGRFTGKHTLMRIDKEESIHDPYNPKCKWLLVKSKS